MSRVRFSILHGFAILFCLAYVSQIGAENIVWTNYPESHKNLQKGTFLVATDNLERSSFRETVILLTHVGGGGSTGIAINRPSQIPLQDAFPQIKSFHAVDDKLYLGGPIRSDAIFALMLTDKPQTGMHEISKNLFFTHGLELIAQNLKNLRSGEFTRAYAGYTGWAAGQLEAEIARGDWRLAPSDSAMVFDSSIDSIWQRLSRKVSGQWI